MAHSSDNQRRFELRKAKHVGALCHRFPALETVAQTNSGASGVGAGAAAPAKADNRRRGRSGGGSSQKPR